MQGIGADASGVTKIIVHVGNVAVFAISPPDILARRGNPGPHRGRRPLRDGLPIERRRARISVGTHMLYQLLDGLGLDCAWVDGRGPDAPGLVAPIELDRKEDSGRLGPAIGYVARRTGRACASTCSRTTRPDDCVRYRAPDQGVLPLDEWDRPPRRRPGHNVPPVLAADGFEGPLDWLLPRPHPVDRSGAAVDRGPDRGFRGLPNHGSRGLRHTASHAGPLG